MLRRFFTMSDQNVFKKLKTSPLIGTHNGHFHADEALAVYLLRLLPTYQASDLVRTRDPAVLSSCHTVVDVGGEYTPDNNRYDHHQRTFDTTFPSHSTKLSSAGLVYMHFGKPIISQHLKQPADSPAVSVLYEKLYDSFIEALDAHDNGISPYDANALTEAGIEKRFKDGGVSLGSLIGDLNPNWTNGKPEDAQALQKAEDEHFLVASDFIGKVFSRKLDYYSTVWLPARDSVQQAYDKRTEYDATGRVMVFQKSVPWKDHLYSIEREHAAQEKVLYILYPEGASPDSKWRIQCVPVSQDSFESRKPLAEVWRGVRDDQLEQVSGIEGAIFVHASGFIGGAKTFEGVKRMAEETLSF